MYLKKSLSLSLYRGRQLNFPCRLFRQTWTYSHPSQDALFIMLSTFYFSLQKIPAPSSSPRLFCLARWSATVSWLITLLSSLSLANRAAKSINLLKHKVWNRRNKTSHYKTYKMWYSEIRGKLSERSVNFFLCPFKQDWRTFVRTNSECNINDMYVSEKKFLLQQQPPSAADSRVYFQ